MKITFVSFYSGHIERGAENWLNQISLSLSQNNKITVIQSGCACRKDLPYQIIIREAKLKPAFRGSKMNLNKRLFLDLASLTIAIWTLKIIPVLLFNRNDIVIPLNGGWQVAIIRIITWLKREKMVIVGHSGIGWDDRNNLFSFPDCFVVLSPKALLWAQKVNPFVKSFYIPDGIDTKLFNKNGDKVVLPLPKPIILAVGALEKEKRLDLTIKAVSALKKGSLLILGEGSLNNDLTSLGNNLLKNRFMIMKVSFDDIAKYYRSVNLFTLVPWQNEAFGMVYLEAMASNLAVVASDDEVRREIIGEAGLFVNPNNLDLYTKALKLALSKNWESIPNNQANKYSWEKVAFDYQSLFNKL